MTFWPKYLVSRQYSRGLYLEYPYPDDFLFRYLDSGQPLLRPAYTYITSVLLIIQIQTFMWQSEAGLRTNTNEKKNKPKRLCWNSWKEIVHTLLAILNMKGLFGTDRDYVVVLSQ